MTGLKKTTVRRKLNRTSPIGILAGGGSLPVDAAKNIIAHGRSAAIAVFREYACMSSFKGIHADIWEQSAGQMGFLIKQFKKYGVQEILLVGKTGREKFSKIKFDFMALQVFAGAMTHGDQSLLQSLVRRFEQLGFTVLPQSRYLNEYISCRGIFSKRKPTKQETNDIRYGFRIAKKVAALDIGQGVTVYNGAIIAVEAIEGTNAMLKRCRRLIDKKAVFVKVAQRGQDPRFDTPGIGYATLRHAHEAGCTVIAFEAGKTFFLEREKCITYANNHKLCIIAVDGKW